MASRDGYAQDRHRRRVSGEDSLLGTGLSVSSHIIYLLHSAKQRADQADRSFWTEGDNDCQPFDGPFERSQQQSSLSTCND